MKCFDCQFQEQVYKLGEKVAIHYVYENEEKEISYSQLNDLVNSLCFILQTKYQIKKHNFICVCISDGIDLIICILICIRLQCIYVPINISDPRCIYMIQECHANIILYSENDENIQILKKNQNKITCKLINYYDLMTQTKEIQLQQQQTRLYDCNIQHMNSLCYMIYTSGSTGKPKGVLVENKAISLYIKNKIYYSQLSINSKVFIVSSFTFDPYLGDLFSSLANGNCICITKMKQILNGGLFICLKQTKATHICLTPSIFNLLVTNETMLEELPILLPNLYEICLGGELMNNKIIYYGVYWYYNSHKVRINKLPLRLVNIYGVTEATVYQSYFIYNNLYDNNGKQLLFNIIDKNHFINNNKLCKYLIGQPYNGITMYLYYNKTFISWEEFQLKKQYNEIFQGELCIQSIQLSKEYLNQKELSKIKYQIINKQCVYFTGDIIQFKWLSSIVNQNNKDMEIYKQKEKNLPVENQQLTLHPTSYQYIPCMQYISRIDHQIKFKGYRIELNEIVCILKQIEFLIENAIVVLNKIYNQTALIAYISLTELGMKDINLPKEYNDDIIALPKAMEITLLHYCTYYLPQYMIPSKIFLILNIKNFLSPNGKLQYSLFQNLNTSIYLTQTSNIQENDHDLETCQYTITENIVGKIWSNVFGFPFHKNDIKHNIIKPNTSFLELGGDSLIAINIVSRLIRLNAEYNTNSNDNLDVKKMLHEAQTYGEITGTLAVKHLITSTSLGNYCSFLDTNNIIISNEKLSEADLDLTSKLKYKAEIPTIRTPIIHALYQACQYNMLQTLKLLLNKLKVNPDGNISRKTPGLAPIHLATIAGNYNIVLALIEANCNVMCYTPTHSTAIHLAITTKYSSKTKNYYFKIFELLYNTIRKTRKIDMPSAICTTTKQTLLHTVCRVGNETCLLYILKDMKNKIQNDNDYNRLINAKDRWNRAAIHWCVINQHEKCLQLLIQYHASIFQNNNNRILKKSKSTHLPNETPLQIAKRIHAKSSIIQLLQQTVSSSE